MLGSKVFAAVAVITGVALGQGVPSEYAGDWVCQTSVPGYNLPAPVITGQAPSGARITTPPSVAVIKFRLAADGTYEADNGKGRYSYDPASKAVDWLDGAHHGRFSKTTLSKRSNGAPAIGLISNRRYYGCFLSKGQAGEDSGKK